MKTPSLLLFDLGGVLIENKTFVRLNGLLPQPHDNMELLKERWLFSSAIRRFELGQTSVSEFAAEFIEEWRVSLTAEAFIDEFITWPIGFYPQARETLNTLQQTIRVACLSNSNALHWKRFDDFQDVFDPALSSHLLGAIKPDPEAFLLAIEACDVEPAEIYFFDDLAANVQTAQSLGMQAFQVDGFDALKNLLVSQGLLSF